MWDYEKNSASPDEVSYGSNKIYWWKCEYGHSFDSPVKSMTRNKHASCPYCRGLRVNDSNSLATHYPKLINEWVTCVDDSKLTPYTITPGSSKKVKWKCNKNHEWITTPKHRTSGLTNCPKCNQGNKISKPAFILFYYLKQKFDDTTLEFPVKNSRFVVDIYIPSQNIALEYDGSLYHRQTKRDQRKDKELLEKMPQLKLIRVREPDCGIYHSINKNVIKYNLSDHKTNSLQDCLIKIFDDIFNIQINADLQNNNIDILNQMHHLELKNSLGELYPHLVKEWDTEKNKELTPFQFRGASHEKIYWKCDKNHSWLASIASRSHGENNCPYCGSRKLNTENNLAAKFPELISECNYNKIGKLPQDYFAYSHFAVWWVCSHCNYEWQATITNRTSKNSGCPIC